MKKTIIILLFVITHCTFIIEDCMCQWEPDIRLTNAPGNSYTSLNNAWCIAANGNVVHTVWQDYRDGNYEIYYKRSTNNGINWGADIRLTNNSANSWHSSIAVSGSLIHIVWIDLRDGFSGEVYYKSSTDGGVTWGTDIRLTNNSAFTDKPSIAVSGSIVHIVWEDERDANSEIYYKSSSDGGINWGADIRLTNNTSASRYPSIAVSGNLVHIVWYDERDGNREIYFKRSTDGGLTWGADTRLTNNNAISWGSSIAVSGSLVHVVWFDDRDSNWEIYYKRSIDAGINWGADNRLTNNAVDSWDPSISVSGSIVHIVWSDKRDGNYEIYYKRSTNGGTNWEADIGLTNNSAESSYPSIAVSGSIVHTVWYDDRDGNFEIYYKRNPMGNLVGIQNISTEIPSAFSLEQNYPNPFNAVTSIKFKVESQGYVKLDVFDISGRELDLLVNGYLQPGSYQVNYDAGNLPSGVYFYKLTAGNFSDLKRMILIK